MSNRDQNRQIGLDIPFRPVTHRHDKIIIVASSPEARKFKSIPGYAVIAVNAAIHITAARADYWITVDCSESNMDIMKNRPYRVKYFAAIPWWFGSKYAKLNRLKSIAIPTDIHYLRRIEGEPCDRYVKYGLSEDLDSIHTGNSAYAALNLAYHMGAKEIIILGVNGDRNQPKFDNKHCIGRLDHLPTLFESAVKQLDERGVKVYNANKQTMLRGFEYTDIFD